ncbi:hypothetical protein [Lactobacillus terrae]|uniref:hypothetical protein n=1 Tax=Lactobacillus terrae TaxID=2269374 RepID=UPI000C1B76B6|nr:hypothetical protein [Lactobacillus terrae]
MDFIENTGLVSTIELGLMALACYGITTGIKQTKLNNSYMPFVSMGVGILVGLIIGIAMHDADLGKATLAGFFVGGWTSGLFTGFKGITGGYQQSTTLPTQDTGNGQVEMKDEAKPYGETTKH